MTPAFLSSALPWLLSAITLIATVLTGRKLTIGWAVSLAGQALWLTWIVASGSWGFLPLTAALTLLYSWNWWSWHHNPPIAMQEWKEAVIEGLIVNGLLRTIHEKHPRLALRELIQWEVKEALDPAISFPARQLIEEGRRQGHKEALLPNAYMDHVDVDRLNEALSWLGYATYGQEETTARMSELVNNLARAILTQKRSIVEARTGKTASAILDNLSNRSIYMEANDLINRAVREGKVLTISTEPITPLSMGNHRMVPEVRDARELEEPRSKNGELLKEIEASDHFQAYAGSVVTFLEPLLLKP